MRIALLHVEQLLAYYKRGSKPRCEAEISYSGKMYRDMRKRDYRCERQAKYCINGNHYCSTHAGHIALEHLIKVYKEDNPNEHAG